ncbi:MAG: sporulation protein YqfD [Blautia sp.]
MKSWRYFFKGYLKLFLKGTHPERFLNLCAHHQIPIWNLCQQGGCYELYTTISGFHRMKPICQKTKSRIRIIKKYGMPFFFYRNKKRKAFFAGIFLAGTLLILLSGHIWNIHIEGNLYNSTPVILDYLEEINIYHGIPKNQVDCAFIAEQLRKEFPDMTWVSARISGSRLLLEIRENQTYQKQMMPDANTSPCNLYAKKSGRILSMITRKGIPLKKPGDTCEKGELLVSGQIPVTNDSQEIIRYEYTQADADISIAYSIAYYQEFPMTFQKAVYTGKYKTGYVLQAGPYCLLWKRTPKWKQFETVTTLHQLRLTENFSLPFFYGTSTDYEAKTRTFRYSQTGAKKKAQQHLQLLLETLSEKGVQISANHVRIELNESSCTAKGTLTIVEKNTAVTPVEITEQPTERNNSIDE